MSNAIDLLESQGSRTCGFSQLIRSVTTEKSAIQFFQQIGLLKTDRLFCVCGSPFIKISKKNMKMGFLWVCTKHEGCGKTFNPLRNTWFERSHLSFLQIFDVLLHWFFRQKVDLSIVDTDTSEHTICDWFSFCREVCHSILDKDKGKIGGPGVFVEVDEAHLFRRKYNRGHKIKGESVWILGGVCRNTKERFAVRIPNRKKRTIWPILKRKVARGSILVTDDFKSYVGADVALGFSAHEVVVHKYSFVNPIFREIFTNNIECCWGKLKRVVHNSGSDDSVDKYISEYLYRNSLDQKYGKFNYGAKLLHYLKDVKKIYPGPNRR